MKLTRVKVTAAWPWATVMTTRPCLCLIAAPRVTPLAPHAPATFKTGGRERESRRFCGSQGAPQRNEPALAVFASPVRLEQRCLLSLTVRVVSPLQRVRASMLSWHTRQRGIAAVMM